MKDLLKKYCVPCEGGAPPLAPKKVQEYLTQVPNWQLNKVVATRGVKHQQITREFKFKDFAEAMIFINKVAKLAEAEEHHPDIIIHWNKVRLDLWTHAINGLFDNDFILAAKINRL